LTKDIATIDKDLAEFQEDSEIQVIEMKKTLDALKAKLAEKKEARASRETPVVPTTEPELKEETQPEVKQEASPEEQAES